MATQYKIFAGVTPGLEPLLLEELSRIVPAGKAAPVEGGVELAGGPEDLWRIALQSRLAETLRVRLGRAFQALTFEELVERAGRLAWSAFFPRGGALPRIQVTCKRSRLYHSGAVAQRLSDLLRIRLSCSNEQSGARVHVRIHKDSCQISIDAGGEPLHRRGYRKHLSEAPLRETLAAAALTAAGYRPEQPLWDPFCGAGTIPLEALSLAAGAAPGSTRSFAFQDWPVYQGGAFADLRATLPAPGPPPAPIIGSDWNSKALAAAKENETTLGLPGPVSWIKGDFISVAPQIPRGAAIVANPPYGRRSLSRKDDGHRLGKLLKERRDLNPVVLLNGDPGFPRLTGHRWETLNSFRNRGLPVKLLRLDW